jgi:hypothetical protein
LQPVAQSHLLTTKDAECFDADEFDPFKEAFMHHLTKPSGVSDLASTQQQPKGVGGWLLVLCLMLTLVGPGISIWLMTHELAAFSPYFPGSPGLRATILASLAVTAIAEAFGVFAGILLWLVRPGAVKIAKTALLLALTVDIATTALYAALGQTPVADGAFIRGITAHMIPSLIFFTLCFGYLNKSNRVSATYQLRD